MGGGKKPKKIVAAPPRQTGKQITDIRAAVPGQDTSSSRLAWRLCHMDVEDPWAVTKLTGPEIVAVAQRMKAFETMSVQEIFKGNPGKHYQVAELPSKEARDRLDALQLSDMTEVSALRISGPERLYGFLIDNVFHVLWWDPRHEIWPSRLKHT